MKTFLIVLSGVIGFSFLIVCIFGICFPNKPYKVEIDFCDNRPSIVTMVESRSVPSNRDIRNQKLAVTRYEDYFNVCNVKVVN
jgi:hypothetical protein